MGGVSAVYGRCMDGVWMVYGWCMDGVWIVYEECMEDVCLVLKQLYTLEGYSGSNFTGFTIILNRLYSVHLVRKNSGMHWGQTIFLQPASHQIEPSSRLSSGSCLLLYMNP